MAYIKNFGIFSQLRSEASNHIIRFRNGRVVQSGRGITFWFWPENASISEVPMDDREMTVFIKGRSKDFQDVGVQGTVTWHVANPQLLAQRVDFSVGLANGIHRSEPLQRLEARLNGLVSQATLQYMAGATVRELLDNGLEPLRALLQTSLASAPPLADIGIDVVAVRLSNLAPSKELERALQTPTFEALQQKADQATFERRALAVEKERAIAENELANKTELARREKLLIAEEAQNARNRASGVAEAGQIEAAAEAERIRTVESARAEAELARIAIYRDISPSILVGLAAREFAGKLKSIEHLNVTPDLLAAVMGELRQPPARIMPAAR
ncbi:MAG TPA: SPFH domain-containing protein [Rhizomicrobium sp.]|jgi:regulator of protease activity HflC (stomatin/prohibitin superfamily)|nr:SPFH domain-containing protein [Rhizomicrobium sp.]